MSLLRIQTLCVSDCVLAVEREYYEWGRNKLDHAPEPPWEEAPPEERRAVSRRGYSLFDGCPTSPNDEIGPTEVYTSMGVASRVMLNDAIRLLVRADRARVLLSRIAPDATLEDATEDQIGAAEALIDLLSQAPKIGRGKATKVLHKKRPSFMPILDSVVCDFLWKNFPHVVRQGPSGGGYVRLFREILLARRAALESLQVTLASRGLTLSTTRVLDFLIWLGWRGRAVLSIKDVWKVASIGAARAKARESWEAQRGEGDEL